jgi:hypothetical protein
MKARKEAWVKPALVRKAVQETLGGAGSDADTQGGEFPIQS